MNSLFQVFKAFQSIDEKVCIHTCLLNIHKNKYYMCVYYNPWVKIWFQIYKLTEWYLVYYKHIHFFIWPKAILGPSWPWSYGSWIYNYQCNRCLSPLMLWVRLLLRARCTTLCDKVCQWLAAGRWFSPCPPASSATI